MEKPVFEKLIALSKISAKEYVYIHLEKYIYSTEGVAQYCY